VTVAGTGQSFDVAAGERILAAGRRAGVWFPFECGWGGCGTCKVSVVEGETALLFEQAPCVDPRDARRRRIVVCQSTPVSDVVLKPLRVDDAPLPERPTRDHLARLDVREELGPDIARFHFRLDHEAAYRPGQHAILELAPGLRRCYSMAGPPGSRDVSFIAKHYTGRPGSDRLFALEPGAHLPVELPYGDMWLRDGERPVVLVAGGTGISAILALAQHVAQHLAEGSSVPRPVHVFYGARTRDELVCWGELEQAVARLDDARLHGALLEPGPGWPGGVGHVTAPLTEQLPALAEADFYVAGPPPMTDAVRALLRENDVQLDRIRYDSFG